MKFNSVFETARSTGYQNGKVTVWVKCGSDSGVRGNMLPEYVHTWRVVRHEKWKSGYATLTKERTTLHVLKLTFWDICRKTMNFPVKKPVTFMPNKKGLNWTSFPELGKGCIKRPWGTLGCMYRFWASSADWKNTISGDSTLIKKSNSKLSPNKPCLNSDKNTKTPERKWPEGKKG